MYMCVCVYERERACVRTLAYVYLCICRRGNLERNCASILSLEYNSAILDDHGHSTRKDRR